LIAADQEAGGNEPENAAQESKEDALGDSVERGCCRIPFSEVDAHVLKVVLLRPVVEVAPGCDT
jgi:hypothetical protein